MIFVCCKQVWLSQWEMGSRNAELSLLCGHTHSTEVLLEMCNSNNVQLLPICEQKYTLNDHVQDVTIFFRLRYTAFVPQKGQAICPQAKFTCRNVSTSTLTFIFYFIIIFYLPCLLVGCNKVICLYLRAQSL